MLASIARPSFGPELPVLDALISFHLPPPSSLPDSSIVPHQSTRARSGSFQSSACNQFLQFNSKIRKCQRATRSLRILLVRSRSSNRVIYSIVWPSSIDLSGLYHLSTAWWQRSRRDSRGKESAVKRRIQLGFIGYGDPRTVCAGVDHQMLKLQR